MDSERLKFSREHRAETETLLREVVPFKADMRGKIEALRKAMATRVSLKTDCGGQRSGCRI